MAGYALGHNAQGTHKGRPYNPDAPTGANDPRQPGTRWGINPRSTHKGCPYEGNAGNEKRKTNKQGRSPKQFNE